MGTKRAVPAAAVQMNRRMKVRDLRNWTGKSRSSGVVKMQNCCWRAKRMNITPQETNVAMVRPSFQAQLAPPKVRAMTNEVKRPAFNRAPIQSTCLTRWRISRSGCGSNDGIKRRAGTAIAKMTRLI